MVGINPGLWNGLDAGKRFVSTYRLTFTNLWDSSNAVRQHYGSPYTSEVMLVDKHGNRVEQAPSLFSASQVPEAGGRPGLAPHLFLM